VVVTLVLLLVSCGGSQLNGRWIGEFYEYLGKDDIRVWELELEFFSDGTVVETSDRGGNNRKINTGSWTVENNRLSVQGLRLLIGAYNFSISGGVLTIEDDKDSATLTKDGVQPTQKMIGS